MVVRTRELGTSELDRAISTIASPNLVQACGQAAGHMAEARKALGGESLDLDQALAHLDDAIACLQRLSRRGKASEQSPESTVVAFESPKTRRSA
ncbi:MAG: hypothetical protein QNJ62_07810 [Methyloceanibacter sp.]|nr:hypothetical protein [Methyloceanibacter sp.]